MHHTAYFAASFADTIGFFLIVAVIIGLFFKFKPAKPQVYQPPPIEVPPVAPAEPLPAGSTLRATVEPLPNNVIRLVIQLSHEAYTTLYSQGIMERILFEEPNPHYEKQKRTYDQAWERYAEDKQSVIESVRWFAKEPIDPEPSKVLRISVGEFCNIDGFVRKFDTIGEAKRWQDDLRKHIETLKNLIEDNKKPPEKKTYEF